MEHKRILCEDCKNMEVHKNHTMRQVKEIKREIHEKAQLMQELIEKVESQYESYFLNCERELKLQEEELIERINQTFDVKSENII